MTALSSIQDPALRDWVDKEIITDRKLEADYKAINLGVKKTLQYLVENERNFPSGSVPVDTSDGMIHYDNVNKTFNGRANSRWESIKSGVLNTNVTAVTQTGVTGVLMTYTLPANTLNANGKIIRVTNWGLKIAANDSLSLQIRWNGTVLDTHFFGGAWNDWFIQLYIIRTGLSAQDWNIRGVDNRDDRFFEPHTEVESGTATEDETTDLTLDINVSSVDPDDGARQDGMIVELLN